MNTMKIHARFLAFLFCWVAASSFALNASRYSITRNNKPVLIYLDEHADSLVVWAVNDLADDIETITGNRPAIQRTNVIQPKPGIYVGEFKDGLIKSIQLAQLENLKGTWERFYINSFGENLVISGSDVRGTVYGIFEVSKRLGISPWKWWADVKPQTRKPLTLEIEDGGIVQHPSVQYRGIFLNDEDWGLQPWAAKTLEPETGDIGPKTYEKVFQLLLRLKANTIWPAMHPCTKAFFSNPANSLMADKYHIIVGTSHCEPMHRNNVSEWDESKSGAFNYFTNKEAICNYWQSRISNLPNTENIFTLGMRGVHDGNMQGGKNSTEKVHMLEDILLTQQKMLSNTLHKSTDSIAQTMVLYKEVLDLYDLGLKVPDNVTLMWCDDNYGYIRRLSNAEEQKRSGGSGVYYHLSYWGSPHDYLWLSTTQPGLIYYEMSKAYANGAQKIWIANVGDIKPAEYNTELFLDLAWNIHTVNNDNIDQHLYAWAAREFTGSIATDVSRLMMEYYRLAMLRKPEFMGWSGVEPKTNVKLTEFNQATNGNELQRRIRLYKELYTEVDKLKKSVPGDKLDAWFQLVEYPVKGAALMNWKFLYAQLASETTDLLKRKEYMQLSDNAYQEIASMTRFYNDTLSSGKWKNMMSMNPRELNVFNRTELIKTDSNVVNKSVATKNKQILCIQANEYTGLKGFENYNWKTIKGLGYSNNAITLSPFRNHSFAREQQPYIEYSFETQQAGPFELNVRTLPCHANKFDHQLGIQIDKNEVQYFSINTRGRSEQWKKNILRNCQITKLKSDLQKAGKHTIRLYVNQTGIVIDQLSTDFAMDKLFYEIPYKK